MPAHSNIIYWSSIESQVLPLSPELDLCKAYSYSSSLVTSPAIKIPVRAQGSVAC